MSDTRQDILSLGDSLIRQRGYNAFSYQDISGKLGIKNAAIHYYFPKKSDLAIHIIRATHSRLSSLEDSNKSAPALQRLKAVIETYTVSHKENKVCLMGAFASEFFSLDENVQQELRTVAADIHKLVTTILADGKKNGEFRFKEVPKVKAMLVITNLLAGLQIERITGKDEFTVIQQSIIKDLTT
ncbi:MAG: TetR/AcrR family transcriptional regulator [Sphingobacteriales bacterium]|nr:MAG: TetR/AcrR family transcriptional regulator [Sphingobacteriales bacterium]